VGDALAQDYRGYTLHEIPPSGQGIAALIALGILEHFDVAQPARGWRGLAAPAD
jgi:gamma-glutamyltranspeptidase/glutathione hydrolase